MPSHEQFDPAQRASDGTSDEREDTIRSYGCVAKLLASVQRDTNSNSGIDTHRAEQNEKEATTSDNSL